MNRIFENPFTWAFIGLFTFLTFMAIGDSKTDVAKEETKQIRYQWKIDSVKAVK